MIYKHDKRTIHARYGVVVITHGEHAGRLGYFDDDSDDSENKSYVYLYKKDFTLDTSRYHIIPFSHFLRVEVNELCYEKMGQLLDNSSYGWSRFNALCDLCGEDVGEAYRLIEDTRKYTSGCLREFWVCPECKSLSNEEFAKMYQREKNIKACK